jgi:hypothetical protein
VIESRIVRDLFVDFRCEEGKGLMQPAEAEQDPGLVA